MSVREGQARLRRLSNNVANDLPHSKEDKDFLSSFTACSLFSLEEECLRFG